mmetsp:Transcript_19116/g.48697  ORF Transcript_19116/g.48697 Transcript_19116/m.48697 type:complete len:273 (+) Transcript_19116:1579-2397(+)
MSCLFIRSRSRDIASLLLRSRSCRRLASSKPNSRELSVFLSSNRSESSFWADAEMPPARLASELTCPLMRAISLRCPCTSSSRMRSSNARSAPSFTCCCATYASSSSCSPCLPTLLSKASPSLAERSVRARSSRNKCSEREMAPFASIMPAPVCRSSTCFSSSASRRARSSPSSFSLRVLSLSASVLRVKICSRKPSSVPCSEAASFSCETVLRKYSSTSPLRACTCAVAESLSRIKSFLSFISSFTVFSCPIERPAPCSTRRERLAISVLS